MPAASRFAIGHKCNTECVLRYRCRRDPGAIGAILTGMRPGRSEAWSIRQREAGDGPLDPSTLVPARRFGHIVTGHVRKRHL